jgi:hypothetical protein
VDVRELVAAKERDALYKALDHEDAHTGQDIHLVVEDAVDVRDVGHIHYFLNDEGNGTYEDMVAGDKLDGCSIPGLLAILPTNLEKDSGGDQQQL